MLSSKFKVISPNDETDDLSYDNMVEILELTNEVGRRNGSKVVGNQEVEAMPKEIDSANTETVLITPPTGANKDKTGYYMIAIGIGIIVCSVVLGIKGRRMRVRLY